MREWGQCDADASGGRRFAALTVAGLGLVACGDDGASSSEPVSMTVTASEPSEGKYTFDVPDEVEGGTVQLDLQERGCARDTSSRSCASKTARRADQVVSELFAEDGAPIPDFVLGAPGGGGGTAPGATNVSTISLEKGTYVYFCTFSDDDGAPHYQNGMLGEFTVKDVGSTAALPDTDASIEPSEYKFDVSGLKAGENTITFANKGKQFHHVIAVPLADGATLDEAVTFLSSEGEGSDGPPPVDFEKEQDVAVTGPGEAQVVNMTFESGSYVFLCFITDKEGGPPHFTKGMVQQVEVT